MPRTLILGFFSAICLAVAGPAAHAQRGNSGDDQRLVLVELYTSQGCDMCPTAERILGEFGESKARAVPLAFHVDYFNDPWKDPFSEKLYSERQASYNAIYTKPKNPEYGLYYTPMMMVDGIQSVNGRDPEGLRAAVRAAQARPPEVAIKAGLELGSDRTTGDLRVDVSPRTARVVGREVLVCAVLRDDLVLTEVPSGENANKTLNSRYPARSTQYEIVTLDRNDESKLTFPFRLDPTWKADHLGVVLFVQDRDSGAIFQSAFVPWGDPATRDDAGRVDSGEDR